MYGQPHHHHRPRCGPRGGAPPSQPQPPPPQQQIPHQFPTNPNFYIQQNPNFYSQNPAFLIPQNPAFSIPQNPYIQNPTFSIPQNPNFSLQQRPNSYATSSKPNETLDRIEKAIVKAHHNLLLTGETVSAWSVSQSALLYLRVDSWSSLGFQMQQVPSLYHLMVNAFIHCFVGARRITSLYDLDVAICKNEGVERFEELKLGPLVRHPLVVHYFSVPSGTKEVHRITTEGIISRLVQFIDGKGKFIQAEEFLQFLATKESVEVKEKLGVRIQSLKLHITSIQDSRKAEESTLKNYVQGLEQKSSKQSRKGEEEFSKPPSIFSQKKVLDKRFTTIAQRIKSFSPIHADFGGKHIRFLSSSSEDENDDNDADNEVEGNNDKVLSSHCKISSQDRQSSDKRVTSCPYPSAAEEMTRLGLKVEMDESSPASGTLRFDASKKSSGKKRKKRYWNQSTEAPSSKFPKRYKAELSAVDGNLLQENDNKQSHDSKIQSGDNSSADEIADLSLTEDMMDTFITTWKDTCRVHSVTEVLRKKLKAMFSLGRRKEKIKSIFSLYPCIGLLNIAIKSIKCGMWDNLYDTFQTIGQHGCTTPSSAPDTEFEMIDVELSSKRDALPVNGHSSQLEHSVTVDDILKKVGTYFENGHSAREGKSMLEKQLICLRRLRDCEIWLTEQFSVKDFGILGYGEFFKFLEENSSRLPNELYGSSSGDVGKKSLLEVSMLGKQLVMLLSQAASSLWGNDVITKHHIYSLLKKQFPVISLQVGGNDPLEDLSEFLKKQEHSNFSSCVLFSVTLLPSWYENDPFVKSHPHLLEATGLKADLGQKSGALGSVSAKDAIDCLLRAPMLSDLLSWSHWDLTFAPSLGPLVEWLLTEVHTKELLCLVTKDGKIIRIDHSVTVDEFLEAALQGSSFRTAVKLLSLLSLYGGDKHIPLSLLKCHARQAIEVIVKNSLDAVVVRHDWDIKMHEEALTGQQICTEETAANQLPLDSSATISLVENQDLSKHLSGINKTIPVASRFILDCLVYLPSEFCCFAADIFLSGLRSFTKDAPLAILRECTQINQRMMLHDIGLSLGIMEWIGDYHTLNSSAANALLVSLGNSNVEVLNPGFIMDAMDAPEASENQLGLKSSDGHSELYSEVCAEKDLNEVSNKEISDGCIRVSSKHDGDEDATLVIESIRREEFGLVPSLTHDETSMLKKQHARLGRALHCLSQELYSQDSHFLLELVQNADDNIYPESVEPTLVFILQATGIVVLNNEQGFSAQNIRALCDVGNSTKRGSSAGYIGQKGIGFKSVFRVTDAPEIHSNGFHVKFDISEGQIGFVLPTVVSPCDIDLYGRLVPGEVVDRTDNSWWKTCIVLPFKSKLKEGAGMSSIISMFSDLHPSLLLFLHRLRCIKFKNMLTNDCIVMRRETLGNGIVKVSHGKEKMSWFVASQKLQASVIRPDVQTTEIAIAFTLEELANGEYKPHIEQQPVFAFLPLRTYGLKFILQGDFVLPSSREEVDGDSAWNQWLLSEFPGLFVSALRSFCALPCFQESPGKAVVAYMSFVPLVGEVHGFFSHLPRMIISKLRISNCMIIEGHGKEWVPPCRVLRGWDEHAHNLLPESLLNQHLGLGYLDKDIVLSDPLAKALGVQDYGPKILVDVISSICQADTGMKSMGLDWLSSWLSVLYTLLVHSSGSATLIAGVESDLNKRLRQVPFIPLSDGTYSSVAEGPIWLPSDAFNSGFEGLHGPDVFPSLYEKLRTVSPALLSSAASNNNCSEEETLVENCIRMLNRIGVQRLSAHDIIIVHILPAISDDNITNRDKNLMTEYLSFVMLHLQSSCPRCCIEKEHIISELRNKAFVLTNHGYKRPVEVSIHFSKEFGNPVDVHKLIDAMESKWHEVDIIYLKHARIKSSLFGLIKWREFFQELGVTDFVQIIQVEKNVADVPLTVLKNLMYDVDLISPGSVLKDWESLELVRLVSTLSSLKNPGKCEYLLKVLDEMWDDFFSSKVTGCCISKSMEESKLFKSSFIKSIHDVQWIVSSMDQELHYSTDLFHDCEAVRSILGASAPYAVPQVRSRKFVTDMGFKTQVTLDDALKILEVWRRCETPFKTSIAQMSKFYSFIWDGADTSKSKISAEFSSGPSIFVPFQNVSRHDDVVHGMFLSRDNVYWQDPTGSVDLLKKLLLQCGSINETNCHLSNTLAQVYHGLHDFFVNECRVCEIPPFRSYVQILLQLSKVALPSQAANAVFQVILKWADDLKSGLVGQEDVLYLKEFLLKLENTVLPTVLDKWVSLHPTFGLVCWCDDEELRKQFKHSDNISFLYFGELSDVPNKISRLMQTIGVPSLSEVITREAIFYGVEDFKDKASLVDWVLPFAQRYIYKLHPDKYFQLKQSGLENLSQLQIVVVEKLFYRYTLKGGNSASNKRLECSCLLQENVLYVTRDSDSHSIFLELSRLFYHGTPELHLANFLHMITTMAETGSTKEQTEFFIVNSQKIPELPDDELVWGLPSLSSPQEDFEIYLPTCSSTLVDEQNQSRSKRKPGTNTNWPPADWKTAPDFNFSRANRYRTRPGDIPPPSESSQMENKPEFMVSYTEDHGIPVGVGVDWNIQDESVATMAASLQDLRSIEGQPRSASVIGRSSSSSEVLNQSVTVNIPKNPDFVPLAFNERDQLCFGTPNEHQAVITGRLGEFVAFKYLTEKVGEGSVNWVNEATETGLPYDIVIGKNEESKEYIEVKATKSARKDWFAITSREWQFAVEKGESFSVAHVVLMDPKNAKVTVFKNPTRLCQQGVLQLAVLMSKNPKNLSSVS
ncbi:protein of unknown function DUF3883 [Macleaya cordata]|uniref:Uncharacterized protein n=1 Tax=Macleaya cordata TaxID=56857 RepID=A0A200Q475_MACCD|nr:protein of unknown function DUF3883 [Macleaya cordata]